ncbi:MAG: hypothetical protein RLZZ573_1586, partial [Pseudomonadota bacterium]
MPVGCPFWLARHFLKHPVDHTDVQVHMPAQAGAQPVDESDCAKVRRRLPYALRIALGADTPAFAGIGNEVVVSAVIITQARAKPWAKMPHSRYLRKAFRTVR